MKDTGGLLEKYQVLLLENRALKKEVELLKAQLGIPLMQKGESQASPQEKIRLFMSLFKGRDDVYARRWENKAGKWGYSPVCLNEWKPDIYRKPAGKCFDCSHASYAVLNERAIEDHLRGNITAGIYPLLQDETCCFLAIDLDGDTWQKDVSILREVCIDYNIPVAIERSRSGDGAHVWFFFEPPLPASIVRRFGSALLTSSMNKRHEIKFRSYDRLFPNQDTIPKGGFGNLIALPLQKKVRENGNSVFIDGDFHPYKDQWAFLYQIKKLTESDVNRLIKGLCNGNELGDLQITTGDEVKPWEPSRSSWSREDVPERIELVRANMLYIKKAGFPQRIPVPAQRV